MFTDHDRFVIEKRSYRRPWFRVLYCFMRNKYAKSTYKQVVKAIRKEGVSMSIKLRDVIVVIMGVVFTLLMVTMVYIAWW